MMQGRPHDARLRRRLPPPTPANGHKRGTPATQLAPRHAPSLELSQWRGQHGHYNPGGGYCLKERLASACTLNVGRRRRSSAGGSGKRTKEREQPG